MFAFTNLTKPKNIRTGIADYALVAPLNWISKVQAVADDGVTIEERHVFKPGKGFLIFALAPRKNQFTATTVGDAGNKQFQQVIEMFLPGSYADLHATVRQLLNTPLIILAKDASCCATNMYYQVGDGCIGAYADFTFTTGTTGDGVKGYSATVTYYQQYVQLYDGFLDMYPDEITPSVFLANLKLDTLNSDSLASAYQNGYSDNWQTVYDTVKEYADLEILYFAYAATAGTKAENYVAEVDFSSIDTFKSDILSWLASKDPSQTLTLTDDGKMILGNGGYFGIAIPRNFLDTGDGSLLSDSDGTFIKSE